MIITGSLSARLFEWLAPGTLHLAAERGLRCVLAGRAIRLIDVGEKKVRPTLIRRLFPPPIALFSRQKKERSYSCFLSANCISRSTRKMPTNDLC